MGSLFATESSFIITEHEISLLYRHGAGSVWSRSSKTLERVRRIHKPLSLNLKRSGVNRRTIVETCERRELLLGEMRLKCAWEITLSSLYGEDMVFASAGEAET